MSNLVPVPSFFDDHLNDSPYDTAARLLIADHLDERGLSDHPQVVAARFCAQHRHAPIECPSQTPSPYQIDGIPESVGWLELDCTEIEHSPWELSPTIYNALTGGYCVLAYFREYPTRQLAELALGQALRKIADASSNDPTKNQQDTLT